MNPAIGTAFVICSQFFIFMEKTEKQIVMIITKSISL